MKMRMKPLKIWKSRESWANALRPVGGHVKALGPVLLPDVPRRKLGLLFVETPNPQLHKQKPLEIAV